MTREARNYDDIIGMKHHVSRSRPRMSATDRAAQFSPFAALTGFEAAITETGRLTDGRIELGEDGKTMLDEKLRKVLSQIDRQPEITLLYFKPDARKSGGAYVSHTGRVRRIDLDKQSVILTDGTVIEMENLYDIIDV